MSTVQTDAAPKRRSLKSSSSIPTTAATSSAARTPASSWAMTRPPLRLWREKRGEIEPEDLSDNLIVQLGTVTEESEPRLVSALTRPDHQGRPEASTASRSQMDGGDARRHGRTDRRGVRGQVHAALDVLGRSGGREAHGAAAAQYVGRRRALRGAFDHYRRRQMGRDQDSRRPALSASPC